MIQKIISFLKNLFKKHGSLKSIEVGKTQVWYGREGQWNTNLKLLSKELDVMEKYGVTGYVIEMTGASPNKWTDKWNKEIKEAYEYLLSECRARNMWLHVSIANDNLGKGKYGDPGTRTIATEMTRFKYFCKIVKDNGPKNVVVQPVAETQTAGGKQFETYCKNELKGFLTCYNGNGGHPSGTNGMTYYAVHPSKISAKNPNNALIISDHGQLIRELNQGGALYQHGDPNKITTWVKNNKAIGVPVIGYYAFEIKDLDEGAIKALGKALKQ